MTKQKEKYGVEDQHVKIDVGQQPPQQVTRNVRVSSNPRESNLKNIENMLMKNRFYHKDYDSVFNLHSTREAMRNFVFQNTDLKPYRRFNSVGKIHQQLERQAEKEGDRPPSRTSSQEEKEKKEFQMMNLAKWMHQELDRPPFVGFSKEDNTMALILVSPEYLRVKKNVNEKLRMDDEFEERIHQVFNPFGQLSRIADNVNNDRMERVYTT